MRSLPVQLDDETLEALEMERRLIGFESRAAYVRWIVDHRASIAEESDDAEGVLETYRKRIATLEQRLAARTDREPKTDVGQEPTADAAHDDGRTASAAIDTETRSVHAGSRRGDDGWTRSKSHPSVEVRGTPRTTISRTRSTEDADSEAERDQAGRRDSSAAESTCEEGESTGAPSDTDSDRDSPQESDPASDSDFDGDSESPPEPTDSSPQLSPERVVRISEDPVSEDADVLGSVEFDRLDELSRRAVAKTRSRLNRSVETGLEYRSSTGLVDGAVRPGADVVDLDSLSLPGHDEDLIEARREVVGRAIALLRDEERARKSDFVDALYATHPAGYETADSWWACLKDALKQVDAIEGGDGSRVWEFTD